MGFFIGLGPGDVFPDDLVPGGVLDGLLFFCILENMGIPKKIKSWYDRQTPADQYLIEGGIGVAIVVAGCLFFRFLGWALS